MLPAIFRIPASNLHYTHFTAISRKLATLLKEMNFKELSADTFYTFILNIIYRRILYQEFQLTVEYSERNCARYCACACKLQCIKSMCMTNVSWSLLGRCFYRFHYFHHRRSAASTTCRISFIRTFATREDTRLYNNGVPLIGRSKLRFPAPWEPEYAGPSGRHSTIWDFAQDARSVFKIYLKTNK